MGHEPSGRCDRPGRGSAAPEHRLHSGGAGSGETRDGGEGRQVRMWGGRFAAETDPLAADYTRSLEIDRALAADDLTGSIAHVHGLAAAGLLSAEEADALEAGLRALADEVEAGTFGWDPALEDVHLNLEAALAERVGPVAGKLQRGGEGLRPGRARSDAMGRRRAERRRPASRPEPLDSPVPDEEARDLAARALTSGPGAPR